MRSQRRAGILRAWTTSWLNPPLAGTMFTTHNSGFGDLVLGGLWKVCETECDEWIINLGEAAE